MNSRVQHLLRTTSVLVLAALLSGPASSVTAREAWQEPPSNRVAQGYGNFPRLPVVAPGADGTTQALYLVEGDTATRLVTLEGTRAGTDRVDPRLSPDDRYTAFSRYDREAKRSVLEVADTKKPQRAVIAEGLKRGEVKGAAFEELTSVAWLDAEHILYSKVKWPSSHEWVSSWEADTPPPVQGEVWMSRIDGKEQRPLASGRIHRVLGATPDGQTLYVTRLIAGHEENREEGFALVDVKSGEMTNLWPEEELGGKRYLNFKLVVLPDGSRRLLFTTRDWGDSVAKSSPVIWMADPESGQAEAIWSIDQGKDWSKGEMTGTIYHTPREFLWSPRSEHGFIYLAGAVLGGVWHVDLETGKAEPLGEAESLGRTGLRLLAWATEGIVIQGQDVIWLLDEKGEIRGEIRFREDEERSLAPSQVSSVVVDRDVPYVHQIYDTPDWFHGQWACGPTSVVMALAYYGQLSGDYGWYVPNEYTHQSACSGEHTFDRVQDDAADPPNDAWGAYGTCTDNGVAIASRMYEYAQKHDVGHYFAFANSSTPHSVKAELDGGALVILSTDFSGGHIVIVRGYTDDSTTRYIVNDPAGDWHDDYWNDNGDGARYTWAEMSPNWYIVLYGPEYLPDVYKRYQSSDGSTISIHNGAPEGWFDADVNVCLMNSNGSLDRTETHSIPVKESWSLSLDDVFGWYNWFSGSAVVMRDQTAVSTVVQNSEGSLHYAFNSIATDSTNHGWGQAGTDIHLPLLMDNNNGWSTWVRILNTGGSIASVDLDYFDQGGGEREGPRSISLDPNASLTYYQASSSCPAIGSGRITSDHPLAVMIKEYSGNLNMAYNGSSLGATTASLPLIMANNSGWYTGIAVQNLGTAATNITVHYHPLPGYPSRYPETVYNVQPHATAVFAQAGGQWGSSPWVGAARVTASQPVVTIVNESSAERTSSYSGFADGSGLIVLPDVRNDSGGWTSGLQVQNLDGTSAHVGVRVNGNQTWSDWIGGYHSVTLLPIPGTTSGFRGPVTVECTNGRRIAAIVNNAGSGAGDLMMTYNGINR